ncbi:MAG: hypothetical protein Q9224_007531 [Gallowayella concinna]
MEYFSPHGTGLHPSNSAVGFPFEKLPVELQLRVLSFSMPQHGLRSEGFTLQRWDPRYEPRRKAWVRKLREEDIVPTNIFQANKSIAARALDVFNRELYMHIDVYPDYTSCRSEYEPSVLFPTQVSAKRLQHLKAMRMYQINVRIDDMWYYESGELRPHEDMYSWQRCMLKESLRLISDPLSSNKNLQRLTVTIPCLCVLKEAGPVTQARSHIVDLLRPLKRLRVVKPVQLIPVCGCDSLMDLEICNRPDCLHFAHCVGTELGQLKGEALSFREETWKRIKAAAGLIEPYRRVEEEKAPHALVHTFWSKLDQGNREEFDTLTCVTEEGLRRELHRYQAEQQRRQRQEVFRWRREAKRTAVFRWEREAKSTWET